MERALSVVISLIRFCRLTLEGLWIDLQLPWLDLQILWLTWGSDRSPSENTDCATSERDA